MNAGELHHKVRTRRPRSDSTRAGTSAAGTTKVDPRYGNTTAIGAQQVVRAAADQLDYRNRLWNLSIDTGSAGSALLNRVRRSGLANELVASLEDGWRCDLIGASVDTECGSAARRIVVDYGIDIITRFYIFARAAPGCCLCSLLCRRDKRKQSQQRHQQD